MKTISKFLSLALIGATAVGCATNGQVGGGGDDVTGGDPGDDDVGVPVDASGKYAVTSNFDIATNMPGKVGAVVNTIIDITDDPGDPSQWLIEQVLNGVSNQQLHDALLGAAPVLAGVVQDKLNEIAPAFLTKMILVGNHFGDALTNFGTDSELNVTKSGSAYTATHTVSGVRFKIDTTDLQFPLADYGYDPIVVSGVPVGLSEAGKLTVGEHKVPFKFGQVLRIALDEAIIPAISPTARNLGELMVELVDCHKLGVRIDESSSNSLITASAVEAACGIGLNIAAGYIYSRIDDIDSNALEFDMNGVAKAIDSNRDGRTDKLQHGAWAGNITYANTPAPMVATDGFFGERM